MTLSPNLTRLVAVIASPSGGLQQEGQSAIFDGAGNVRISVCGHVATLTGDTDGASRHAVERVALTHPGIDSIVNLVTRGH